MTRYTLARFGIVASLCLTAGTLACGGDSPTAPAAAADAPSASGGGAGGGTAGGNAGGNGRLTINLTDSPFSDARSLLVTFSEVSVHKADPGEWKTLPFAAGTSRTCDLKKLTGGATDVLGVGALAAGHYTQIRLHVTSAELFFDSASTGSAACAPTMARPSGASATVDVPSGEVRLNNEFTVATSGTTILLDFDGDQSIRQTGGGNGGGNGRGNSGNANTGRYMMSPVIRVVSVR